MGTQKKLQKVGGTPDYPPPPTRKGGFRPTPLSPHGPIILWGVFQEKVAEGGKGHPRPYPPLRLKGGLTTLRYSDRSCKTLGEVTTAAVRLPHRRCRAVPGRVEEAGGVQAGICFRPRIIPPLHPPSRWVGKWLVIVGPSNPASAPLPHLPNELPWAPFELWRGVTSQVLALAQKKDTFLHIVSSRKAPGTKRSTTTSDPAWSSASGPGRLARTDVVI